MARESGIGKNCVGLFCFILARGNVRRLSRSVPRKREKERKDFRQQDQYIG
jgi:hypothetical protein